jgi:hypothetical protein
VLIKIPFGCKQKKRRPHYNLTISLKNEVGGSGELHFFMALWPMREGYNEGKKVQNRALQSALSGMNIYR